MKKYCLNFLLIFYFSVPTSANNNIKDAIYWLNPNPFRPQKYKIREKNNLLVIISPDSFLRSLTTMKWIKKEKTDTKILIYFCPNSYKDPQNYNTGKGIYKSEPFVGKIYKKIRRTPKWILRDLKKPNNKIYVWNRPPMFLVNTTRLCPKIGGKNYIEWWVDYISQNLILKKEFKNIIDGVFIDCLWPVISHYIENKLFSNKLDFNGNNKSDEGELTYQEIDKIWRAGNEFLISLLRKKIGQDKIIIGNHMNLSFLKNINPGGKMLEGFPGREFQRNWIKTMLHFWALERRKITYNIFMLDKRGTQRYYYLGLTSYLLTDSYLCPWANRLDFFYLKNKRLQNLFLGRKKVNSIHELNKKLGKPCEKAQNPYLIIYKNYKNIIINNNAIIKLPNYCSPGRYCISLFHNMSRCKGLKIIFEGATEKQEYIINNRWPVSYHVNEIMINRHFNIIKLYPIMGIAQISDVLIYKKSVKKWTLKHTFSGNEYKKVLNKGRYAFIIFKKKSQTPIRIKFEQFSSIKVKNNKKFVRINHILTKPTLISIKGKDILISIYKKIPLLWTRKFTGGIVYVNPENKYLTTEEGYIIPPKSGKILLK